MEINPLNLKFDLAKKGITIIQPNRITNAYYDFTLIQERLLTTIIFCLQEPINLQMNGLYYTRLPLFKEKGEKDISLEIPLSEIVTPAQYAKCRLSLKKLAGIVVEIPYYDNKNKERRIRYSGLFRADISEEVSRSSTIRIYIERQVAKHLIEIDLNNSKIPIYYTQYIYETALHFRNRYASRIYKFISSWKKKGKWSISLDDFRERLRLEDKYPNFKDFKYNVLLPAQKELIEKADCWFDCNDENFYERKGKKVIGLNFRIHSVKQTEIEESRREQIRNLVRIHFRAKDDDIQKINELFKCSDDTLGILNELDRLSRHVRNPKNNVYDPAKFVIASLVNKFGTSKIVNNSSQFG